LTRNRPEHDRVGNQNKTRTKPENPVFSHLCPLPVVTSGAWVCVASRGTVERGQDWPCAVFGESELKMRRHSPHGVHIACHFPPSLSLLYSLSTRRSMCISSCVIHTSPYSGSTLCHVIDRSGSRFRICRVSCFPVIHRPALLACVDLMAHVDLACEQRILPGKFAADAHVSLSAVGYPLLRLTILFLPQKEQTP
jgi:hypothetical protein